MTKSGVKNQLNNEKGLTLIELLAVVVILGIIAAIAVPAIGNIIQNQKEKSLIADAQMVYSAANLYFADTPDAPSIDADDLKPLYLDDLGALDSAEVTKASGDDEATIDFAGEAGNRKIDVSGITKSGLNYESLIDSWEDNN